MSKKIYNLNGKPADGYGEAIDAEYIEIKVESNKKTGAKTARRVIAVMLLCSALTTYVITETSSHKSHNVIKNDPIEPTITEQVTQPYSLKLDYLYTDIGEKYAIDSLTIATNLDNCDHCQVDGVYFSKTEEELYSVTVVRKYKETIEPTKSVIYTAPQGYVVLGDKCFKLPENFDDSIGYDNLENYTEYNTPEGYILINNKAYQINKELFNSLNIDAIEVGLEEELPEGYIEIDIHQSNKKIGIKKEDYEKAIELEEKTIYSLPSGYILEGNKGVKTVYYKTEYLVTEEQYLAQEFSHLTDKVGEYFSHTTNIVKTKPMKELYDLLGIEYTEGKKLTK